MDNYDYLYNQLQYWRKELERLKQEKKKWERRRKEVEGIKSSLHSAAGNNSADVNSRINWTVSSLERSIDYPPKESSLDSIFADAKEASAEGDGCLATANNELAKEIDSCENRISELDRRISIAQDNVERYQREINRLKWG